MDLRRASDLDVSRGDLNRTSLSLQTIRLPSQAERLAWLAEQLATLPGHGIIYALTVRDANQVADWLKTQGFDVAALPALPTGANAELVQRAIAFLQRTSLPIAPRKKWPDGGMPHYKVKGNIAPNHQAQPGKALCIRGDAGWGGLVSQGKYQDGYFAGALVAACVDMVRAWNPQPPPA